MDNRQRYITVIGRRLAYLKAEVQSFNTLNLLDINVHAENFYRDFFNLLGWSFDNTNFFSNNYAHIDLIDTKNKLAIQVTSQNNNEKIKGAIDGFYSDPKNVGYKLKLLLIAKEAKEYRTKFGNNFNHKEDVLDLDKLLKDINNKELNDIIKIAGFLDNQILQERRKTEANEVETIMALIEFLSNDVNTKISERPEFVDPEFKIYNRFSDHGTFLMDLYKDLCTIYQYPIIEARKSIDSIKAIKISSYLKDESDSMLTKENNNPQIALEKLVELFYEKLSANGFSFDKQAIKYYLLDELINCNVFPNK